MTEAHCRIEPWAGGWYWEVSAPGTVPGADWCFTHWGARWGVRRHLARLRKGKGRAETWTEQVDP